MSIRLCFQISILVASKSGLVSTTGFRYIPEFKVLAMAILNYEQRRLFEEQGYLLVVDAVPCTPNPVPSQHQGEVVRDVKTNHIRSSAFDIPLPQLPKTASFFDQQAQ